MRQARSRTNWLEEQSELAENRAVMERLVTFAGEKQQTAVEARVTRPYLPAGSEQQ